MKIKIKKGDVIGETIQICHDCDAEVDSDIVATEDGDDIGTTKPFTCPYCGHNL
jgi:DNA-directed RNA polymerase subunit RPC12/RpoP